MFDCSCSYLTIALVALGLYLVRKYFGGQFTENVSARGKVAVVTGGNTGIGLATVKELNLKEAKVYMLCRSEQRAADAKIELVKGGCESSRLIYVNCDLGSKENVRKCAAKMSQLESSIDILVNNAGVWMPDYQTTADGHEMTWGTNHLGDARELTRRLRSRGSNTVTVNSLHPGVVATGILRNTQHSAKIIQFIFAFFMKSWKDGAQTSLYCALSSELKGVSGKFYSDCAWMDEAELAKHDLACKQLYEYSLRAVGLD